jgi:hypothetical protein
VVHIAQEHVQRRDTLRQTTLNHRPFRRRNDARDQIVGENFLCAIAVTVYRKRDALVEECGISRLLPSIELLGGERCQSLVQGEIMRARLPIGSEHFVPGNVNIV